MADSPATTEVKRVFKALGLTVLGIAIIVAGFMTDNNVIIVLGLAVGLFLVFNARPVLVAAMKQTEDDLFLYPQEQRDTRDRCQCCGCPTLNRSDDTCLLCEWPKDDSGEIPLDAARKNFRRYLTIYPPNALPEWMLPPSDEILGVRKQLVDAYAAVLKDNESAERWIDVNDLENTLRSLEFNRASRGGD